MVSLGDTAKDSITGFSGKVVCIAEWIHGCRRIAIQPTKLDSDGEVIKAHEFDEPQVKVIRKAVKSKEKGENGGPRPSPKTKPSSRRNSLNL